MDIGLGIVARNHPGYPRPLPLVYREVLDQAVLGEQLGFHSWWLAEHHFAEDEHNPSQFPLLAAAAVRTSTIRLGTYVLLLALHNPLRVAEDAATVDIMSDGRLDLAIGAGPMPGECAVFGIDPTERFGRTFEALEILRKCFTEAEFTHEGRYYRFPGVRMTTKPVQPGGPPVLIAAMGPQSLAKAGELGYHLASMTHTKQHQIYLDAQAAAGRSRADYRLVSGPLTVHVAPTRQQAWDEAEAGLHEWVQFYRRRGIPMPLAELGAMRDDPNAGIFGIPFAVGTPEEVHRVLSAYRDVPLDEMVIQFNHMGVPHERVAASMRLFARELMPELSTWGAGA